jgi:hypothetical protein
VNKVYLEMVRTAAGPKRLCQALHYAINPYVTISAEKVENLKGICSFGKLD